MKKFQLAHLYRNGRFFGYGIAVDGELLHNQCSTIIETKANELPIVKVEFYLDDAAINNPVTIELPKSLIHG